MPDDLDEFMSQVNNASDSGYSRGQELQPKSGEVAGADWAKAVAAASCWAKNGNSYFPVSSVTDTMPPGAYRCMLSNNGPYFEKMAINIDNLLHLPDSTTEKLLAEFATFWTLKPKFDARGFTFKRGMLMWGPPGSGKTSAVWQMTEHLIKEKHGIVVFAENPQITTWCLNLLRRIEPERPVIVVYEDIDAIIRRHGDHELLALLDGEFQINRVVHLATTNYPHLLDKRFVDRPSRFDTIMKVGMPSEEARRFYFQHKEPELPPETIERWVAESDGYSIAHLREVIIATQCFGQDEEVVFTRLGKMRQKMVANDDDEVMEGKLGFIDHQAVKQVRR
jgi:hypothetical protein